jgi:exodeoxyribonuclease VII large subunit
VRFELEEGMQVVAHGALDVYAPRGAYNLIVDRLEPQGIGVLLAELERLKAELAALGWFQRRRPLPELARRIGVVTSRDGAALQDFLRTRSLRWPGYPLRLCHTGVQGPGAALEIARAIRAVDASGVDVIVVCLGGGSLEDLWAFNLRPVAEAIWNARAPVVTGIGHETDTTLADLIADHRAHTPTDAAQTVIPDRAELAGRLTRQGNFLMAALAAALEARERRLAAIASRPVVRGAGWILGERSRLVAAHAQRLSSGARAALERAGRELSTREARLARQSPRTRLERWRARLDGTGRRLVERGQRVLEGGAQRLGRSASALEAYSPLRVLERGYSLTRRSGQARPLLDAAGLTPGAELETVLARGRVLSRVETVVPAPDEAGGACGNQG